MGFRFVGILACAYSRYTVALIVYYRLGRRSYHHRDNMYSSVSNTEIHLSIKRERAVYRLREYLPLTARPARASNARAPGYGRVGSGICVTPRALKASVSKGPIIAPLALIGRGNDLDALMLLGV